MQSFPFHDAVRVKVRLLAAGLGFSALIFGIAVFVSTLVASRAQSADIPHAAAAIPCTVPDGFTITRAAGPPLLQHPLFACFDDQGRLYVIDSGGINNRERATNPTDVIRLLEDIDNDGVFDKSSLFADKLTFGTGLVWYAGALYVTSPPSLWKFEDDDRDGVADKRTELVTGFAFNFSCSNDIHGACLGLDGRIYFLASHLLHKVHVPGGPILREGFGPWLVRCRPDGSQIEFVSGGIGNPVEVTFLPNGDMFLQGTFWAKSSIGGGLRDALIQVVEGGEYSVSDRDYTDRVRTGDFLPALVPMGITAPSGLTAYRSSVFGPEYHNNLFASYFNTRRVLRHILAPVGATYLAASEDFVVGQHGDVHFTDVLEDADGSLLVIDTGGWFRACCPASKIAKPEILGTIYRVARTGGEPIPDPRGRAIAWGEARVPELVSLLDDNRCAVQDRAIHELSLRGEVAVSEMADALKSDESSVTRRVNVVWALSRIDGEPARAASRTALSDADATVRQAAASSAALHRDVHALAELVRMLQADSSASVQREAANALGRIGEFEAVDSLLGALEPVSPNADKSQISTEASPPDAPDRFLEHSLIYSLIRINDPQATRRGLDSDSPSVRRAALIALDQMQAGDLSPEEITTLLTSDDPALQRTAIGILTHHRDWAGPVIALLDDWLSQQEIDELARMTTIETVRAFQDAPELKQMIERRLANSQSLSPAAKELLLKALAKTGLKEVPQPWIAGIGGMLKAAETNVQMAALGTIERLRINDLNEDVHRIVVDQSADPSLRLAALRAVTALPKAELSPEEFEFLMSRLDSAIPVQERLSALAVIASMPPDESRLLQLVPLVRQAGPIELPHLLRAFARGSTDATGMALIDALAISSTELSPEQLSDTLEKYSAEVHQRAAQLMTRLNDAAGQQAERLTTLEATMQQHPGDGAHGRELFLGKANCHLCHQAEGRGGKVGPDLSGIGAVRNRRDLLEAIVFPSSSFARGFEPVLVALTDGTVKSGLMGRESTDEMILIEVRDNKPVEAPIPRAEIEQVQIGRISVMPKGLESQITEQELSDLLTYLQSLRTGSTGPVRERL